MLFSLYPHPYNHAALLLTPKLFPNVGTIMQLSKIPCLGQILAKNVSFVEKAILKAHHQGTVKNPYDL